MNVFLRVLKLQTCKMMDYATGDKNQDLSSFFIKHVKYACLPFVYDHYD